MCVQYNMKYHYCMNIGIIVLTFIGGEILQYLS